jgi:hypothetical protein
MVDAWTVASVVLAGVGVLFALHTFVMTTAHKWPESDFGKFFLPPSPPPVISSEVVRLLRHCVVALESTANNVEALLIVQHAALEFQLEQHVLQEARRREAGAPPDNSSHQG